MSESGTIFAEKWFKVFKEEFSRFEEEENLQDIYIIPEKFNVKEGTSFKSDRTYVMKFFLRKLTRSFKPINYYQITEYNRVDIAWFQESQIEPSIIIEIENDLDKKIFSEIINLYNNKAKLKILITYKDENDTSQITKETIEIIKFAFESFRSDKNDSSYMLIIGIVSDEGKMKWEHLPFAKL